MRVRDLPILAQLNVGALTLSILFFFLFFVFTSDLNRKKKMESLIPFLIRTSGKIQYVFQQLAASLEFLCFAAIQADFTTLNI